MLGAEFAKAVLGLSTERHKGMTGIYHRLNDARVTALCSNAVEFLVHRDGIGGCLLRRRIIPLAQNLDNIPFLACSGKGFVDPVVAIGIDRGTGNAAYFQNLAAVWQVLCQSVRPQHA